jgi:hypothetical protein
MQFISQITTRKTSQGFGQLGIYLQLRGRGEKEDREEERT